MPFMRYGEKYRSVGHTTDDNMVHVHCMLEIYGYTHANNNAFSLQQRLKERASILSYIYIARLVVMQLSQK